MVTNHKYKAVHIQGLEIIKKIKKCKKTGFIFLCAELKPLACAIFNRRQSFLYEKKNHWPFYLALERECEML
jgi:hypothetical protein